MKIALKEFRVGNFALEGPGLYLLYIKLFCLVLLLIVGGVVGLHAQAPAIAGNLQGNQLTLNPVYVPPATGVMFTRSQTGTTTYYYWVITHQGGNPSVLSGPWVITQVAPIASAVPITVQWQAPAGTGYTYDLLRTTTSGPPSGTGNFAVVAATPIARKVDNVTSLASYTVAPAVPCVMTQSMATNCPGSGGGTINGTVTATNVPYASGPDTLSDSGFAYGDSTDCVDMTSTACFTATDSGTGNSVFLGTDAIGVSAGTFEASDECFLSQSIVNCSSVSGLTITLQPAQGQINLLDGTGQALVQLAAPPDNPFGLLQLGNTSAGVAGNISMFNGTMDDSGVGMFTNGNILVLTSQDAMHSGIETGVASPTDLSGTLVASGGAFSYMFSGTYADAPVCIAQDDTAITALLSVAVTNTTLSGTTTGMTDVVSYHCFGTL